MRSWFIGLVVVVGSGTASTAFAAMIGPWEIKAKPTSASLISGSFLGWLNVVDSPVTLNEAFTGPDLAADGIFNVDALTVIELVFSDGTVTNGPGIDLVLFESFFGASLYAVSTDFDSFATELSIRPWSDTGEDRSYFYNGLGPTSTDILAAPIDLSDLGLPSGAAITTVHLRQVELGGDPVGLASASLIPEPSTFIIWSLLGALALTLAWWRRRLGA